MKNLPSNKSDLCSYEESIPQIQRIFGNDCHILFDTSCVTEISYQIRDGKIVSAKSYYEKVKILVDNKVFYWPIAKTEKIEPNLVEEVEFRSHFLEFIKETKNDV